MPSLWISKTGMDAQQTKLNNLTHDLANGATNGYKSVRTVFEDLLYQTVRQPGAQSSQQNQVPSGLNTGTGVRAVATVRNFGQGNLQQTGNSFDLAINGQGFFQILLPDGSTGYSRDGSFQLDNQGQIVNSNGFVVQPTVTVPAAAESVTVAQDGTVSVVLAGSTTSTQIGQFQLATFINPTGLQPMGQNLFSETSSSGTATVSSPGQNGSGLLNQGYVETSNVNVVEALVGLIETQRTYEINSKAIQTSDQMLQRITQL